ncbi:hypothetical protein DUI87_03361 [Hirundo rustica rustica]|uniref:Retroviral Gag polyprotein M domain-containing protein n=1 Tax=Hirundo rustica rustica TaxID=333673 RepID=A0A3M0L3W6_HIRRU|nr:hypothetical protein DUI87_03361 [Hirundo rustica rustica]
MEALVKVVSQIHKQWGIDCKAKDFTLAVTRLLQLSIIDRPVDILHPDVWDQCTKALAEDTMSSGLGKNLKAWGRVVKSLQKALHEQETWRAARNCLKVSPQLGIAAATQTFSEGTVVENFQSVKECSLNVSDNAQSVDEVSSAKCIGSGSENQELASKPPSSRSLTDSAENKESSFANTGARKQKKGGERMAWIALITQSARIGNPNRPGILEIITNWPEVLIVPRVLYHQEEEMYRFLEETIRLRKREVITAITIAMLLGLGATGTATVLIVPRVLYHQEEEMYRFLEETILLRKREVITAITIAMLLGLGATGTATGVSALVTQHQRLSQLQMTIDEDLLRIEKSISSLERSISSLSEVVLQNRRGLDLLLMQQGGLCAALREECCFYADHTGVLQDSMAELRGRLAQRKRNREAQQGWFESWFNQSPWLATLVPTLIGPLTMILLTLIFGPYLLNKLVSFVRRRLEKVDILFVEHMQLP